jgi:hypothetical protein
LLSALAELALLLLEVGVFFGRAAIGYHGWGCIPRGYSRREGEDKGGGADYQGRARVVKMFLMLNACRRRGLQIGIY